TKEEHRHTQTQTQARENCSHCSSRRKLRNVFPPDKHVTTYRPIMRTELFLLVILPYSLM
ncbi:feeding circuit activating peptides-like X4, partial [Biomphalaria pfeifferi]